MVNAVVIFPATNSITFYFKKLFIFVVLKPSSDHLKEDMYDVLTSMYFLPIISFSFGIHVIINNQIWEDISLPINNVMYYLHG